MSKEKKYTEQQERFLEALGDPSNKGDVRKAMDIAGYSKSTTLTSIRLALGDEMIQVARNILQDNSAKAALGLVSVLDGDSGLAAREKIQAANNILDRVGIVKKDQIEVSTNGSAVFILPPKKAYAPDEEDIY